MFDCEVFKQPEIVFLQVSLLINNAGVVSGQYLLDTPDHLIQRTFDVNVLAHIWVSIYILPKTFDLRLHTATIFQKRFLNKIKEEEERVDLSSAVDTGYI